jgi:hypothetical protein
LNPKLKFAGKSTRSRARQGALSFQKSSFEFKAEIREKKGSPARPPGALSFQKSSFEFKSQIRDEKGSPVAVALAATLEGPIASNFGREFA